MLFYVNPQCEHLGCWNGWSGENLQTPLVWELTQVSEMGGRSTSAHGAVGPFWAGPAYPAVGWQFHLLLGASEWPFSPDWMRHFSSIEAEIEPKQLLIFFPGSNPNRNYLHCQTIKLHRYGRKCSGYLGGCFRMLSRSVGVCACVHTKGLS